MLEDAQPGGKQVNSSVHCPANESEANAPCEIPGDCTNRPQPRLKCWTHGCLTALGTHGQPGSKPYEVLLGCNMYAVDRSMCQAKQGYMYHAYIDQLHVYPEAATNAYREDAERGNSSWKARGGQSRALT